jgi:hypothetical protein
MTALYHYVECCVQFKVMLHVIMLNFVAPLGQLGWQNGKLLVLGHFVNLSFSQHGILATPKSVFQFGKE